MGNGYRDGDVLNFQVTANYAMNATDRGLWERAFSKASEILWNATEGQLRIGTIWVTDNNAGVNNAEFVLDPDEDGRGIGTFGDFGVLGRAIQQPAYAQRQVLTLVHELGHHLWALHEEYARAEGAWIDTGATLPAGHANKVIPLVATDLDEADAEYASGDAVLIFGGNVETRGIVSKVGSRINVDPAFSANPQTADSDVLLIQWTDGVECTGSKATGACIMEFSRSNAGDLLPDGTWVADPNPVTEFCTAFNHDQDTDTAQDKLYGESCWETLVEADSFTNLATGAPSDDEAAAKAPPAGWSAPTWVELDANVRLALVLDKSGSMNFQDGARLAGVKTGAKFWIENAAIEDDELTIVWYNPSTDTQLALTAMGSLTAQQLETALDVIENKQAGGGTNIRDGLDVALGQMTAPTTLASVQASVLITDGAHNEPPGTEMDEVLPDYEAANTNIYTLGVGSGNEMDLPGLQALATAAGGIAQTVGDGSDATAIQDKMIEINAIVRGGMVSTSGSGGPDTKKADDKLDDLAHKAKDIPPPKRPKLEELYDQFGVVPWDKVIQGEKIPHRWTWFAIDIEEGARTTTFTLSHVKEGAYWMYLIDPSGQEVTPASAQVAAWNASNAPYEFAKIKEPKAGQWIVLGLRLDRGPAANARAIAAINHPELNVYARGEWLGPHCPVYLTAGARYVELLTGLSAIARLRDSAGVAHSVVLHDDRGDGEYEAHAALPPGRYEGHIEIRSPGNTAIANIHHAILHATDPKKLVIGPRKHGSFTRHVPISFTVGPIPPPTKNYDDWKPKKRKMKLR